MTDLRTLWKRKEPLNNELSAYVFEGPLGRSIKHPILYEIFYDARLNAIINYQFKLRKKSAEKAREMEQWANLIWHYEKAHRLNIFLDVQCYLTANEYWKILREIWVCSENNWQDLDAWKLCLFQTKRTCGQILFMTEDDYQFYENLPEEFEVHRGYQPGLNKDGLSYTLDKQKAFWFANRCGHQGKVASHTVSKNMIFAYLSGGNESEIILKPSALLL